MNRFVKIRNSLSVVVLILALSVFLSMLKDQIKPAPQPDLHRVLNEDVIRNLQVVTPDIMDCIRNQGGWIWQRDYAEDGSVYVNGFCFYPGDSWNDILPEEEEDSNIDTL